MHSLNKLAAMMLAFVAAATCTDNGLVTANDAVLEPDVPAFGDRLGFEPGMTVELEGRTTFSAYASRTSEEMIQPPHNLLLAEGTLTFTGNNHAVTLEIHEAFPGHPPFRTRVFRGSMAPSGRVKLAWPADDIPLFGEHTGCCLPANPKYHGFFDGKHFYVATEVHSLCDGGTLWSNFGVSLETGPLHVTLAMDLTRVD